ncbi:MAG: phenylalanine--tRNA ligase subunit beta [Bacteroidetes bacterium]|nr:MAG: phenylalanine--tRNA ligase subunit beta [Bacteroidota bacterium]
MKISLKWLQQYVELTVAPEDLAHRLTMAGFEIEDIEYQGSVYDKFVVGEVLEVNKHPKADRLTVCKVNTGTEVVQIVCGAPNVAVGQRVPVGLSGAVIPHNQHDPEGKPFALSHVKLRGVDSFGMICSAHELGLGDDKDGIMVFDAHAKVGAPLAQYLGKDDIIFEVGITPNRPDAMSHFGIAREVAALLDVKANLPKFQLKESDVSVQQHAKILIEDTENCPRYSGRVMFNVNVADSPKWLQNYLLAIGLRPVNNVVDITNYVLMELGHPLHAFDYDTLAGKTIVVKRAKQGEKFTTLDHKERTLTGDTLMICDGERSIGVAGVMGGENTEITHATKNVLLESAYFNPASIRRTSKYLGISTDASQRFERGANPNVTTFALDRATALLQELCGAKVLKGTIDVYPVPVKPKRVPLRIGRTNRVLGTSLTKDDITTLLNKIELTSIPSTNSPSRDEVMIEAPTFRVDIEREIDVIEEVARVYGYDNIQTDARANLSFYEHPPKKDFSDEIRDWLIGRGCKEVVANSMCDIETAAVTSKDFVEVANPISKDMAALRTSTIPGMLNIVRNNIFHGSKDIRLFEIGRIYFKTNSQAHKNSDSFVPGYYEENRLAIAFSGLSNPRHWNEQPRQTTLFDLKGELEAFFCKLFLDNYKFIPYSTDNSLTDSGLVIHLSGKESGYVGKIRPEIMKRYEIEQDVFVAEISIPNLEIARECERTYRPLPKYPSALRDVAIVIDEEISVETLTMAIRESGGPLLKQIELFDIYRGNQIAAGKKSCAISLEFNSEEQTLAQEQIDTIVTSILNHLQVTLNASLRT